MDVDLKLASVKLEILKCNLFYFKLLSIYAHRISSSYENKI